MGFKPAFISVYQPFISFYQCLSVDIWVYFIKICIYQSVSAVNLNKNLLTIITKGATFCSCRSAG